MKKFTYAICNVLVWIFCISLLLLYMEKTGIEAFESLTGIKVSGVRGSADYKAISQWICLSLPLNLMIGYRLFQNLPIRKYLLVRCSFYQNWCIRMITNIIYQIMGYYITWGVQLCILEESDIASIWRCMIFQMAFAVPFDTLLLIIWELTENAGSVLGLIFLELSVIAFSYIMPLKVQKFILCFCGMYRYVTGLKEYLFIIVTELFASILIIVVLVEFKRWKGEVHGL